MYVCMCVCVSLSLSVYIYIYMHISSFKWQEPSPQEIKKRDVVTDTHVFLFPHTPERWFLLLYCISQSDDTGSRMTHGVSYIFREFFYFFSAILSSL